MAKKRTRPIITNHHGLLMAGDDECLGYLWHAKGHGVFDANYGKVTVAPEDVDHHNQLLDQMLIDGLDNHCEVGQGGCFYYSPGQVRTFLGTLISDLVRVQGRIITFTRNRKTFRGRLRAHCDLFSFRRVS